MDDINTPILTPPLPETTKTSESGQTDIFVCWSGSRQEVSLSKA